MRCRQITKISSRKYKANHHQTLSSSSSEKQNKGTGLNMYNLTFCYIIVARTTCTDIGSSTVSSRIDISGVCALFLWKIILKYYPETMNKDTSVSFFSHRCDRDDLKPKPHRYGAVRKGKLASYFHILLEKAEVCNFSPLLLPLISWDFLSISGITQGRGNSPTLSWYFKIIINSHNLLKILKILKISADMFWNF